VNVRDQHIEPDARIGQQFVQPVLLAGQHAAELLPLAGNQAQVANIGLRDERGPQQARSRQGGKPLRIGHIGLAPRHGFDVTGVDNPGGNAHALQGCVRALPVNACALHDHHIRAKRLGPLGQSPSVALEAAKFAGLHCDRAIRLLGHCAGADLGLVDIQADDAFIDRCKFHDYPCLTKNTKLQCVLSPRGTSIERPVRQARRLFLTCAVHSPRKRRCQAIRGTSQWWRVELGFAVVAIKRFRDLSLRATPHPRSVFHDQGCCDLAA
jgi:hypothetical protein